MRKFVYIILFLLPSVVFGATVGTGDVILRDVTASRANNTVYQNTTGGAMYISVSYDRAANGTVANGYCDAVNGNTTVAYSQAMPNGYDQIFWVCPNNYYYKFNATLPTIGLWTEWYQGTTTVDTSTSSSTATTTSVIYNPNQDLFNGLWIFGLAMWFVIWFFKIDRKTRK